MLALTLQRTEELASNDTTWIVTMEDQAEAIEADIPSMKQEQLLLEPMARNTAAAIGLAAVCISKDDPDAVLAVLPADHLIRDVAAFQESLRTAEVVARETDAIVTLGIQPSRPETGYGYIEVEQGNELHGSLPVHRFREKPNRETAEEFLEAGKFYWNAGIFVAKATRLLSELQTHVPDTHATLMSIGDAFEAGDRGKVTELYATLESISIDYAVMERAKNVRVIPVTFDWSDVGGYEELLRISKSGDAGNASTGEVLLEGTRDSFVRNELEIPLAVVGIKDVVVVATRDGIRHHTAEQPGCESRVRVGKKQK